MEIYVLMIPLLMPSSSAHVFDINKGVIVQLFEWRWLDIAQECEEFLEPYGFAGVQISPPNENIIINNPKHPRPWWERYQPISYRLKTRSGTEDELQEMLDRCNRVGIRIFADAVLNHMTGPAPPGTLGTDGSTADYSKFQYPEFSELDFHTPACDVKAYNDPFKVRFCQLDGKRDLNQSTTYVKRKQLEFLNKLINMGVAGFRIDAARHMWPYDLKQIYDRLDDLSVKHGFRPGTRPLIYQEVIDYGTDGEAVRGSEYTELGLVTDYKYIGEMGDTFLGRRDLDKFKEFETSESRLPSDDSIVFIDNHETQRNLKSNELSYKAFRPYKMAIAFMLAYPWGTPRIFSGYNFQKKGQVEAKDQGPPHDGEYNILSPHPTKDNICTNDWTCEHRWRQIHNMVRFHNVVAGTEPKNWQGNDINQLAFCRGDKGFIAFNTNPDKELDEEFQTCLPKGRYCDVIAGELINNECKGTNAKIIEVNQEGKALIQINKYNLRDGNVENDGVLAIHIKSKILDPEEMKPKSRIGRWCDSNENEIAFCDEKKGFITFSKKPLIPGQTFKTCLPTGKYCDVISGSMVNSICTGKIVDVAKDGTATLKKSPAKGEKDEDTNYKLLVIHPGAKIADEVVKETDAKVTVNVVASSDKPDAATSKQENPLSPERLQAIVAARNKGIFNGVNALRRGFVKNSWGILGQRLLGNANSTPGVDKNPICDKLEELITKRDGVLTLSTFVARDEEDFEIMKILSKVGREFMVGDLVTLVN